MVWPCAILSREANDAHVGNEILNIHLSTHGTGAELSDQVSRQVGRVAHSLVALRVPFTGARTGRMRQRSRP